jgi:protein-tyrosine-phosphatase
MSIERSDDVERRVRLHAALADPARLRIVDTLCLGDMSPTELQAMLAMSSNLLAHHLNVLEREGLLVRSRSEADRRRSYLRLVPSALQGLAFGAEIDAPRVVFVCTANSARSQLAAALWKRHSSIPVASAGTHPASEVAPGALAVARRHDLPLASTRPRHLEDVVEGDDLVVTVCDNAHEEITKDHVASVLHWSVPDPVRVDSDAAFDAVFTDLTRRVSDLVPRLTAS